VERGGPDAEYIRLRDEYLRAAREYDIALQQRRRVRESLAARRRRGAVPRRPVGPPPPGVAAPAEAPAAPPPDARRPHRVYMGEVLGWVTLGESALPVADGGDPAALDVDAFYGRLSLHLYWNVKVRYLGAKKRLEEYALHGPRPAPPRRPTRHPREYLDAAADHAGRAARLQLLGLDDAAEEWLRQARREVEDLCHQVWEWYTAATPPHDEDLIRLLLTAAAEAQFVGLDDSAVARLIYGEVDRLIEAGDSAAPAR
jgi:hypothetical protein